MKTLEDMEAMTSGLGLELKAKLHEYIEKLETELRRHKESLEYVFERAKLARIHAKSDSAYDYLVQIREKEEALKRGDEILNGERVATEAKKP